MKEEELNPISCDSEEMILKSKTLGKRYIGFHNNRLNSDNPREKAFSKLWKQENTNCTWKNRGHGILQDLFIDDDKSWHHTMSSNDKMIASTVIQWLGSNCGLAFIEQALKECGYKVVQIKD